MKKLIICSFVFLQFFSTVKADEGMWIPLLLSQLNEAEMKTMGMEISAEDIYSINHSSLKDAIVHFGGFCTAEVISDKGLILTNHHCGYSAIQSHSTVENDYLKNGFWARNLREELPNEGLYAEFIRYIEDVTNDVLQGTTEDMSPEEFAQVTSSNVERIIAEKSNESDLDFTISSFYKGNQFFLFATEKYNDVRLVGAPPSSIGKFGSDTDNWVWPRHTGDFSLFRIYANPQNNAAEYSSENIPYIPLKSLDISMDGIDPGDFTMVLGFPGTTDEYLPASAVEQTLEVINPARIEVRDALLSELDRRMRKDDATRIKYASKYAGISNAHKKWIGQNLGLNKSDALDKKRKYEIEFLYQISKNDLLWDKYKDIFTEFDALYEEIEPYAQARNYFFEVAYSGIESFKYASRFKSLVDGYNSGAPSDRLLPYAETLKERVPGFYKNFESDLDKDAFIALMPLYQKNVSISLQPESVYQVTDWNAKGNDLYNNSIFTSPDAEENVKALLDKEMEEIVKTLQNDPIYQMMDVLYNSFLDLVRPQYVALNDEIEWKLKTYMKLQMEVMDDYRFYPDANSTLRLSYGNVKGFSPEDAVNYTTSTYLEGVMAKYKPGDYEFDLPEKLIELYENKDFGNYGEDGKMPVCFIASNHTSGGNSGSPALNARGELIGLNFDRVWEGTMSDINYDVSLCRNIMVDIRYVLFVVDKFAGAGYLIDEMNLVYKPVLVEEMATDDL